MKKHLVTLMLGAFLIVSPIQKAHGAIAAITAIWNAPVATKIAIAALTTAPIGAAVGFIMGKGKCQDGLCTAGAVLGGMLGLVLLEEDGSTFKYQQIGHDFAARLNLSVQDIEIYNTEVIEANLIFNEVRSNLNSNSSLDDSKALWEEYGRFLSPETLRVMRTLADHVVINE